MKVDIWSDIRCPFCYIGKRNFEKALSKFENNEDVEVIWHSFQLDPNLRTQPETDIIQYFMKHKGVSEEQAKQMLEGAKHMGYSAGLELNLEKSIVANSLRAHQLLQFAKSKGLGNEIKEALFKAHFTDARNIDDTETLIDIAEEVGLKRKETETLFSGDDFKIKVKEDEDAAKKLRIQGVPFFVFNRKYAVSGAQPAETFLEVLQKSWEEAIPEDH